MPRRGSVTSVVLSPDVTEPLATISVFPAVTCSAPVTVAPESTGTIAIGPPPGARGAAGAESCAPAAGAPATAHHAASAPAHPRRSTAHFDRRTCSGPRIITRLHFQKIAN